METSSAAAAFAAFEHMKSAYAQVSMSAQNQEVSQRPFPRPGRLPGASDSTLWRISIGLSGQARAEGVNPLNLEDVARYAGVSVRDVESYLAATRNERTHARGGTAAGA